MNLLIESHYLPSLSFFVAMLEHDNLVVEQHEHYQKQSYRNRCQVLGANKVETLSVPVLNANSKVLMRDVRIDNSQRWQQTHWRTLESAYRKSPYFEFFVDYFLPVFQQKQEFLLVLNQQILSVCLQLLRLKKTLTLSENYEKNVLNDVFDARNLIDAKKNLSLNPFYCPFVYQQNFGNKFVPNLSIIDLLFCKGVDAVEILKRSSNKAL